MKGDIHMDVDIRDILMLLFANLIGYVCGVLDEKRKQQKN